MQRARGRLGAWGCTPPPLARGVSWASHLQPRRIPESVWDLARTGEDWTEFPTPLPPRKVGAGLRWTALSRTGGPKPDKPGTGPGH